MENNILFPNYLRYQDPPFFLKALTIAKTFWVAPVYLYCYTCGNISAHADKIKYTLMGIRDNFRIAVEKDYKKLYDKYIDRMEYVYRNDILNYMSDEVCYLMKEIVDINNTYKDKREITVLKQMYESVRTIDDLYDSYLKLKQIIDILTGRHDFKKYFAHRNIKRVIVYGVGFFGDVLIRVLKNADVSIICCVDQKVDTYENLKIMRPDDMLPECDALIISLKDYLPIKENYKDKCTVMAFMQIIDEILSEEQ